MFKAVNVYSHFTDVFLKTGNFLRAFRHSSVNKPQRCPFILIWYQGWGIEYFFKMTIKPQWANNTYLSLENTPTREAARMADAQMHIMTHNDTQGTDVCILNEIIKLANLHFRRVTNSNSARGKLLASEHISRSASYYVVFLALKPYKAQFGWNAVNAGIYTLTHCNSSHSVNHTVCQGG